MKKYNMIDTMNRDVRSELKEYTFDELKIYFEPDKEDFPQLYEKWKDIEDIHDLISFLEYESDGMIQPYRFEELSHT